MLVNVIGLGYIGLPTALVMAQNGIHVIGTDIDKETVCQLNLGTIEFMEVGFEHIYADAKRNGIIFSTEYQEADLYIIAVSTPYIKTSKKVDVSILMEAIKNVLKACKANSIIAIESTISPGTIDKYVRPEIERAMEEKKIKLHIVHTPERIIPGNMFFELKNNARVIGADDEEVGRKVKNVYASFCKADIVVTDIKTAEMSKVVENTYRDINIAFANELTKICREGNMDVYEIIKIANMHPRVNILQPGPGVGGHCISVDPWFLVGDYPGLANIILAARKINDSMPEYVLERVYEIMKEHNIKDTSRVGFYGLTYKEDVDDMRESPTLQLIDKMKRHLAPSPKVYDPMITEKVFENQYLDFDEFLDSIDLMVVMVGHEQLKSKLKYIKGKLILDSRNVFQKNNLIFKQLL